MGLQELSPTTSQVPYDGSKMQKSFTMGTPAAAAASEERTTTGAPPQQDSELSSQMKAQLQRVKDLQNSWSDLNAMVDDQQMKADSAKLDELIATVQKKEQRNASAADAAPQEQMMPNVLVNASSDSSLVGSS